MEIQLGTDGGVQHLAFDIEHTGMCTSEHTEKEEDEGEACIIIPYVEMTGYLNIYSRLGINNNDTSDKEN